MEQLEPSRWQDRVREFSALAGNPEGTQSLTERFQAQYLEALSLAEGKEDRDRVWLAFWHYLITRPTMRKPFQLTSQQADDLIAQIQACLEEGHPSN